MALGALTTFVVLVRWGLAGTLTVGVGSLSWLVWGALQCALAPAHAFVLLSSYPGEFERARGRDPLCR